MLDADDLNILTRTCDTSFVALVLLVPMSLFLAWTKKVEANLFEELEHEAIKNLPPQLVQETPLNAIAV